MIVLYDKLYNGTHETTKKFLPVKIQVREDLLTFQEINKTVVSLDFPSWEFYVYIEKLMKVLLLELLDDFE